MEAEDSRERIRSPNEETRRGREADRRIALWCVASESGERTRLLRKRISSVTEEGEKQRDSIPSRDDDMQDLSSLAVLSSVFAERKRETRDLYAERDAPRRLLATDCGALSRSHSPFHFDCRSHIERKRFSLVIFANLAIVSLICPLFTHTHSVPDSASPPSHAGGSKRRGGNLIKMRRVGR